MLNSFTELYKGLSFPKTLYRICRLQLNVCAKAKIFYNYSLPTQITFQLKISGLHYRNDFILHKNISNPKRQICIINIMCVLVTSLKHLKGKYKKTLCWQIHVFYVFWWCVSCTTLLLYTLALLFLIRLRFPLDKSITYVLRSRYGNLMVKELRKFEKVDYSLQKCKLDLTFLMACFPVTLSSI